MTHILDNSLLSQKYKLSRMTSHEYLYIFFYLKHSQSNAFSFFLFRTLLVILWHPHQTRRMSNFWLNRLRESKSRAQVAWANKTMAYTHIPMEVNKKRCNSERMKNKDAKFIHIISIVTVVYNNGINLKILLSHWRHLTTTFKLPYV